MMFSQQTRQALRVLWWRLLNHAEDALRVMLRCPRIVFERPDWEWQAMARYTEARDLEVDAALTGGYSEAMTNETAPFIEASVNVTHRYIQLDVGKTGREATVKMDVDQAQKVLDQLESAIRAYYAA